MRRNSVCCLVDSFGRRPLSRPFARATAIPSRVRIHSRSTSNSAEGSEDVEEHLSHRVGRVVDLAAKGEFDAAGREPVADVACVGHRPGEPVELRNDEGVAFTEGGERLIQAGPRLIGAGQSVVELDPGLSDAELPQPLPRRGEVLRVGRATTVADESGGHRSTVTDSHPPLRLLAYQVSETAGGCRGTS